VADEARGAVVELLAAVALRLLQALARCRQRLEPEANERHRPNVVDVQDARLGYDERRRLERLARLRKVEPRLQRRRKDE
jgi:hypothetical protein